MYIQVSGCLLFWISYYDLYSIENIKYLHFKDETIESQTLRKMLPTLFPLVDKKWSNHLGNKH